MFVSGFYGSNDPVVSMSVGSIVFSGILIEGLNDSTSGNIIVSKGSVALTGQTPALPSTTLSGASYLVEGTGVQTAAFKIDNDGYFYRRANAGAWVKINTTADWLRPVSGAPAAYQARYTSATGDTSFITATAAENAWYALSGGDFEISVSDSIPEEAIYSEVSFQLEIRDGGSGGAETSGSYTLIAKRADSL